MEEAQKAIDFEEQLRRSGGRSSRHCIVSVRLTRSEQAELNQMAKSDRKALSEWCRDALLAAARGESVSPIFTEVIAIRMLLNRGLRGDLKTPEQFDNEVQAIRKEKHKAAEQVMQQYTTEQVR